VIYPVNPRYEAVQGIHAYPNMKSLLRMPEWAIIGTPAPAVSALLKQCSEAGILGVIAIPAGFKGTQGGRRSPH
jgi:acetyltransferase